jgi:hypothetical protein
MQLARAAVWGLSIIGMEAEHGPHALQAQQLEMMAAQVAKTEEQLRQTTKDYIIGVPC